MMSLAGRVLTDRYHVDRFIGSGNTGEVYVGHDMLLDRAVAIKVLTGGDAAIRARFIAEARAMAGLNDPHIVAIYDFGEVDGLSYIIMEFVDGKMLRDALDAHEVDLPRLLEVFKAVFMALDVAHHRSIIHRDMKPANVLLGINGEVKVTDFGLARRMSDVSHAKESGEIVGTIAYMPPECFLGKAMDARGDLYSVGILMYEAFTGSLPFTTASTDVVAMIFAHVNDVPVPPRALNRHIPTALERVILKLLSKQPDARYDSAHAAFEALAQIEIHPEAIVDAPSRRAHVPPSEPAEELDPGIRALLDRMLSPQRASKEAFGRVVSAMLAVNRRQYREAAVQYITAIEEFRTIKNDAEFIKCAIHLGECLLLAAADESVELDLAMVKRSRIYLGEAGNIAYTKGFRLEFQKCERVANALETAQIRRS